MHYARPGELIGFKTELLLCELARAFALARAATVPRVPCPIVVLAIIIHISTETTQHFGD